MPEYKKPSFSLDYFTTLADLIPNDSSLLYTLSPITLINLRYINFYNKSFSDKTEDFPDYTAELKQAMKADKGLLFDLIELHKITAPIVKFTPLTDSEVQRASEISPVFGEELLSMNNKLKQTIDENKKKSDYTVNRINTEDIPVEELFNAIITPYRDKVVFVDFWATWCSPCREALKEAEPVKKSLEGKDVVFLYIAGENSPKSAWDQMIPDIKGEHYRITDAQWQYCSKKFGIGGVPSYMVIAKDGTPTHFQTGFMGADKMKEWLDTELNK